jgi:cell wall-associated NlpC family hydrolase/prophage tail gpP-like protein
MRASHADISVNLGRHGHRKVTTAHVLDYQTSQSIDNDADTFSVTLGNVGGKLDPIMARDNEAILTLYLSGENSEPKPIFTGIADVATLVEDLTAPITGRDLPTSLSIDSDAMPGRWRNQRPSRFIEHRAKNVGIRRVRVADMKKLTSFFTDGSEKEWQLWYRLARMRGMYMWADNLGTLIVDHLGYSTKPRYHFGVPPKGANRASWIQVEQPLTHTSTKQGRIHKALIYGTDTKRAQTKVGQSIDHRIDSWTKRQVEILSSTKHRSQVELAGLARDEIFEGIVGAEELVITVRHAGVVIEQNTMAMVNLPDYGYEQEMMFVVGVERSGSVDTECIQTVRLREKGFALTKRVPDSPTLDQGTNVGTNVSSGSIAEQLGNQGVRWPESFVRATQEFRGPWDFAVFLGVLLSICAVETGFKNERQIATGGFNSGEEWQTYKHWLNSGDRLTSTKPEVELQREYEKTFANNPKNRINPFYPANAGVGPMQLTSSGVKAWADAYGWSGKKNTDEYQGGRWNPDSNIRAAARSLGVWLRTSPPANPTNADSIWIGVGRYNAGLSNASAAQAYITKVKREYKNTYYKIAQQAVLTAKPNKGSSTKVNVPGYGPLSLPSTTPDGVKKAINFALRHLGDPYKWGGSGPHYDCSSFVCASLAYGGYGAKLDEPHPGHHGDNTYTLFRKGRFKAVSKDALLPGDLVFFIGNPPDHVGMYLWDGLFIQDPRPGEYVNIQHIGDSYWRERYTGARRVASWPGQPSHPEPGANP